MPGCGWRSRCWPRALILYCAIYYAAQQRFPGSFELTSTVNNTMPLVFAGVAQTHRGDHPRPRPLGRRRDRPDQRDRRDRTARSGAGMICVCSLVVLGVGAACGAAQRLAGRHRAAAADPGDARDAVDLPGPRDPGAAAARRGGAAGYTTCSPTRTARARCSTSWCWSAFWFAVSPHPARRRHLRDRQRRGGGRAHGVRVRRRRSCAYVLSGRVRGRRRACSSPPRHRRRRDHRRRLHPDLDRRGGAGRDQPVRRPRQRDRRHARARSSLTMIVNILFFAHIDPLLPGASSRACSWSIAVVLAGASAGSCAAARMSAAPSSAPRRAGARARRAASDRPTAAASLYAFAAAVLLFVVGDILRPGFASAGEHQGDPGRRLASSASSPPGRRS